MVALSVNGKTHDVNADPNTDLLWVLRDYVGLTGTKYGCGIAQCGACTVHVDGVAVRSCSLPLSAAEGKQITTIEGLAQNGVLHKVQKAWIEHDVPQCGYCQCGHDHGGGGAAQDKPKPTDADIDSSDHQHLPLRHLPAGARGDPRRRQRVKREATMNYIAENESPQLRHDRRRGRRRACARPRPPVRRSARDPRPGRHTRDQRLGGDQARRHGASSASPAPRWGKARSPASAQLVAEELECDWSKVTWRISRRPARTSPASACGATLSTGGSRGIRKSHEYVRQGGAAAREMLKQAAANEWKVPVVRSARRPTA